MAPPNHPYGSQSQQELLRQRQDVAAYQHQLISQQQIAGQQALQLHNYQQNTYPSTSQVAAQQQAYNPPPISTAAGSFFLPPLLGQTPPTSSDEFSTNTQAYSGSSLPLPWAPPPLRPPSTNSGGFSTNTQAYSGYSLPPFLGLGAPTSSSNTFSTNIQGYPRWLLPPHQAPSTSSGGFPTNTQDYSGWSLPPPQTSQPLQAPSTSSNTQCRPRNSAPRLPSDQEIAPLSSLPQPTHPLLPPPKHPHKSRMCRRSTYTFQGCPCEVIVLKSCKGDIVADEDISTLAKCEEFKEDKRDKAGNCKGKGHHWACPAMIRFWSEKKVESQDGSFIWV